jgi:hypothetical protein
VYVHNNNNSNNNNNNSNNNTPTTHITTRCIHNQLNGHKQQQDMNNTYITNIRAVGSSNRRWRIRGSDSNRRSSGEFQQRIASPCLPARTDKPSKNRHPPAYLPHSCRSQGDADADAQALRVATLKGFQVLGFPSFSTVFKFKT